MLIMITIRTAKPSDIPQLVELLKELFTIEADVDFDQEKQACGLNQLLNSDKDCIFVAELLGDNKVLGMCTVMPSFRLRVTRQDGVTG